MYVYIYVYICVYIYVYGDNLEVNQIDIMNVEIDDCASKWGTSPTKSLLAGVIRHDRKISDDFPSYQPPSTIIWLVVWNMAGLFSISYMGCHPSH